MNLQAQQLSLIKGVHLASAHSLLDFANHPASCVIRIALWNVQNRQVVDDLHISIFQHHGELKLINKELKCIQCLHLEERENPLGIGPEFRKLAGELNNGPLQSGSCW